MSEELTREQVEIAVMQASNTGSIEPLKRILETDAALRAKVEALQTCIEDRDRDIAILSGQVQYIQAQQAKGLREVAEIIRITFPKAHTYASENADVYRAQDDTVKAIVHKLEAQATAREQQP